MKKRILSLVLALSMMISLFPVSALAQTPGGGSAEMAEENGYITTLEMNADGRPVTDGRNTDNDGNYIGTNWKYTEGVNKNDYGTLTLTGGTWDFTKQNAVKCDVMILKDAVVSGGMFEGIVWNEADGKISGGTFKKAVSNKGTITGGIFVGVDLENTSVINYDTGKITGGVFENNVTNGDSGDEGISASITGGLFKAEVQNKAASAAITGGVFVTKPTGSGTIANGYTLTTSGTTSKFVYAADGKEIDLGQSVYVIPNNTDALKVVGDGVSNWDVADGSGVTNGDGVTLKQDGSFTLNPDKISGTTLKFTVSTTPVIPDPELVLAGGVPDTSTEHAKQKTVGGKTIYYGNGWTYDGETLKLNPTSAKEFTLNSVGTTIESAYLNCDLEIGENATVKGTIALTRKVTNNGMIDKLRFGGDGEGHYPSLTNNGTVQNCSIEYASVTNNKKMENVSIVACSSLENTANATIENVVVRKFGKEISYSNLGSIDNAVFEFNPKIDNVHVLKASSGETVGATLSGIKAVVFGTEVYIVGEPEVKVKISGDNAETITDVNGNKAYGGLESGKDSEGFQKFIVQEKDKELVLNQIGAPAPGEVKHTLTLKNAMIVKDDGSTDTTGEYKERTTVKIKPQIENQWKVFNGVWYTDPYAFIAREPNEDDTYTLTMPGYNLTVEACSVNKSYTLTVKDGTIEGAYSNINMFAWGSQVRVTANAPKTGEHFAGWEAKKTGTDTTIALYGWSGNTIDLTKENLIFQMPTNNVTLTATYAKNPKYTLTVDGGYIGTDENQTSGNYEAGATIKLTAKDAAEGKQFDKWKLSDGLTLVDGYELTNTTIKVTMPGHAATATATYKDKAPTTYTLTVDGGYIGTDENQTSGNYEAGATIKLTAKAKTGYHFTKWTVEEGTLSLSEEELKANPLTFEMPDGAVSLKANYEKDTPDPVDPNPAPNPDAQPKTYTVTVKGGKINNKTEVKAEKGTKLTVDVDESEVPEGMTFDVWSIRFPEGVKDTLTGDPSVMLHDPHMSFAMPEADITIEAQYRSSELPGEDDGPSALGTMATVAVGGAAAGILVWQGVSLGVDSYLQLNLPKGVAVPANRRELVVLLWETAGKPEVVLPSLYSDVPAEEIELQKATRWAIDNGLVKPADDSDASRFDPDRYVTKYDVFGAWLKLKKLMK